jgi:hypothetical protein
MATAIYVPYWAFVALFGGGAYLLRKEVCLRFSLQEVLMTTTVIAVALGLLHSDFRPRIGPRFIDWRLYAAAFAWMLAGFACLVFPRRIQFLWRSLIWRFSLPLQEFLLATRGLRIAGAAAVSFSLALLAWAASGGR